MSTSGVSGSSGSSFNVSGIASGLDWKTMVDQMMAIENNPVVVMQTRKKNLQDKDAAYQDINTKMLSLNNAMNDLMLDANLKPKKATVNSPTVAGATSPTVSISATANPDTPVGDYSFSVTQLATATTVTSSGKNAGRLGADISQARAEGSEKLSELNFSQSVTAGKMYLSLNGNETVEINVDPLNDTLKDVFDRIDSATGGRVKASISNNKIELATDASVSSLSVGTGRDTSNFATATFLNTSNIKTVSQSLGAAIDPTVAMDSAGFTALASTTNGTLTVNGKDISYDTTTDSINDLVSRINNTDGVNATASYDSVKQSIVFAPTDNNKVAASDALGNFSFQETVSSSRIINSAQLGKTMDSAGIAGLTSTSGTLLINGVEIKYDTSTDSLNNLIGRINASDAKVLASYDAINDKLKLTSKNTGATGITLSEKDGSTGTLLSDTGLFVNQSLGQNAKIKLEGGTILESVSNTFTNIAAGLSVTALAVSPDDTTKPGEKLKTTLSVNTDLDSVKTKTKAFIDEFNKVVDTIDTARAKGAKLAFDGTLGEIRSRLFSTVSSTVAGLSGDPNSFLAIGIGTTQSDRNHLSLDETKFEKAFTKDPDRVGLLFRKQTTTYKADGSVDKVKNEGLVAQLNDYLDKLSGTQGFFKINAKSTLDQTSAIDASIKQKQDRLTLRRANLTKQFTAMEQMVSTMKNQQSAMMSQLNSLS